MIYVDPPRRYKKRGKRWSHLFSPDLRALLEFAKKNGLKRRDSSPFLHFDILEEELPALLKAGAIMVDRRDVRKIMERPLTSP